MKNFYNSRNDKPAKNESGNPYDLRLETVVVLQE
jgi:hypothetical protein